MKPIFYLVFAFSLMISCDKKSTKNTENQTYKTDTLKQKDGAVLTFKKYDKPLVKMMRDQTNYSDAYKNRIKKIVEYYLANNNQSLIRFQMQKPDSQLGFSMEENDWENVNYTQVGVFNKVGSNASTLQWLFYEPKSQKLYEFDLNKKKLAEFPLK